MVIKKTLKMKYKKITLVDSSLGTPVVVENLDIKDFKDLQKQVNSVSWKNKLVTVRGLNVNLSLEDAKLPEAENLVLFLTTLKTKGGIYSKMTRKELMQEAKKAGITGYSRMKSDAIVKELEKTKPNKAAKNTTKKAPSKTSSRKSNKKENSNEVENYIAKIQELEEVMNPIFLVVNDGLSNSIKSKIQELRDLPFNSFETNYRVSNEDNVDFKKESRDIDSKISKTKLCLTR